MTNSTKKPHPKGDEISVFYQFYYLLEPNNI